jgi:hypothetical protein
MDRETVKKLISDNKAVQIIFYENDAQTNELIKFSIDKVLQKYYKTELSDLIYGCVKELVINATKANVKRVFFQNLNYDINNMGQYVMGLTKFKGMLEKGEYEKYFGDLRSNDLWVIFNMQYSDTGVKIELINNTEIIEIEDTRIRMKLRLAMAHTSSFLDLYKNEMDDDNEGAGMGIALIILLLRSGGLDPDLFRIGSQDGVTIARLEIPFTKSYVSSRGLTV